MRNQRLSSRPKLHISGKHESKGGVLKPGLSPETISLTLCSTFSTSHRLPWALPAACLVLILTSVADTVCCWLSAHSPLSEQNTLSSVVAMGLALNTHTQTHTSQPPSKMAMGKGFWPRRLKEAQSVGRCTLVPRPRSHTLEGEQDGWS